LAEAIEEMERVSSRIRTRTLSNPQRPDIEQVAIPKWTEVSVSFEHEGSLGLCVTDTENGAVVINGPPDNGYVLVKDGDVVQLPDRR